MPQIAIIADIHANLFALDAVVDDLEDLEVDEVLVAGDLVGRGPQGTAVVERIRRLGWRCVRGNHEDYLLGFCRRDIPDSWWRLEQWAASRWMARELDDEAVEFIDALPFSIRSEVDADIEVFHGSPNSHSEGIGRWTPTSRLETLLESIDGTFLACAHTHRPLDYDGDSGRIVNVGSVGLPFNGDWRAQYALISTGDSTRHVQFRAVPYPRHRFLKFYETSGFLEEGRITARLLYMELKHARPFLVPFLKWAELTDHPPTGEHLEAFLDVYDPQESSAEFFERIRRQTGRSPPG